jgi:hypothetical protein
MSSYEKAIFYGWIHRDVDGTFGKGLPSKRVLRVRREIQHNNEFYSHENDDSPEIIPPVYSGDIHAHSNMSKPRKCKQTHRKRMNANRSKQSENYF